MVEKRYKFIDLFAGLGGFHKALEDLGCECVFASELKEDLQKLYSINFPNTRIEGDITQVFPCEIPAHDILCAGFPCQPFSQAGKRLGFNDDKYRGNLFNYIYDILEYHNPSYVLLENVANLKGHDQGNTWKVIETKLKSLNYDVKAEILSPHQFGIPQHRKRIYIVCKRIEEGGLKDFEFPIGTKSKQCNINDIIDKNPDISEITPLRPESREQLKVWSEFLKGITQHNEQLPSFPIWAMEFGATYDYKDNAPAYQTVEELRGKRGKLGQTITGNTLGECLSQLPNYAQTKKNTSFPDWKKRYIELNRDLYNKNKSWIDKWLLKVRNYENSHLKLEWNCGKNEYATIEDKIIQFRASGIRVKLPTYSPALNLVGTQIPIFPWVEIPDSKEKGRYMTIKEAAALQGMQDLSFGNSEFKLSPTRCYEALGNAVNVNIVSLIARKLFKYDK